MDRQEFEQGAENTSKAIGDWALLHPTIATGIVCFLAGYIIKWLVG